MNEIPQVKGRRYVTLRDGQIRHLPGRRWRFAHKFMCCDCGLVHIAVYKVKSPSMMHFAVWRDNRATAARRTHRKK